MIITKDKGYLLYEYGLVDRKADSSITINSDIYEKLGVDIQSQLKDKNVAGFFGYIMKKNKSLIFLIRVYEYSIKILSKLTFGIPWKIINDHYDTERKYRKWKRQNNENKNEMEYNKNEMEYNKNDNEK